jgi:hypothetical protein
MISRFSFINTLPMQSNMLNSDMYMMVLCWSCDASSLFLHTAASREFYDTRTVATLSKRDHNYDAYHSILPLLTPDLCTSSQACQILVDFYRCICNDRKAMRGEAGLIW